MKIRCTHCGAEYEMEEALLQQTRQVACGQCHQVFTAEVPGEEGSGPPTLEEPAEEEMEQLLAEMEETLAGLESLELSREPLPAALDTGVPEEMAELKATEVPPELLMGGVPKKRGLSWPGLLAVLFLGAVLLAQVAWLERDRWLDQPRLRALAAQWCPYLGCTLPPRQPRLTFSVEDGRLETTAPRRYRLRLLLRNRAGSSQPLPSLQVSLTDDQQRLVARRTFDAPVYTGHPLGKPRRAKGGETLEVELQLAVPSERVAGYEVSLIPAGA